MDKKECNFYCYKKIRKPPNINKKIEPIKLVVFDMDGVLADTISSWKYIHDYFNTSNEESVNDYLHGKIDDEEFIRRDVSLWKENNLSIKLEELQKILDEVPVMNGAKECIKKIKDHGVKTAIVSAGLDLLADRIAEDIGIDYSFANGLKINNKGRLSGVGIIGVRLMYKDQTIINMSKKLGIPLSCIASIGNSCFDIPMFDVSGLGIAFNPSDDCVCDAADYIVQDKNLGKIPLIIEKHI